MLHQKSNAQLTELEKKIGTLMLNENNGNGSHVLLGPPTILVAAIVGAIVGVVAGLVTQAIGGDKEARFIKRFTSRVTNQLHTEGISQEPKFDELLRIRNQSLMLGT